MRVPAGSEANQTTVLVARSGFLTVLLRTSTRPFQLLVNSLDNWGRVGCVLACKEPGNFGGEVGADGVNFLFLGNISCDVSPKGGTRRK